MIAAAIVIGIAVALTIAAIAHYRYWVRRLTVPLEYVDHERIETPDGSAIELRRIPAFAGAAPSLEAPPGGKALEEPTESGGARDRTNAREARPPVLLVHGIGIDHQNNDMLPDLSLARHLAAAGRDCWLLTLRSGRAGAAWRERGRMRFERMARHDLPIGIARVLERTGAPALDYVGFSMGGMLLYAALGRTVSPSSLRRIVILGSPAIVRLPWPISLFAWLHFLPWWMVPSVPLRLGARMIAFAIEHLPRTPIHRWVYNPENVERGIAGASLMTIHDVPAVLSLDFARWAARGGALEVEGERVLERLRAMDHPILFFAGAADRLAPPEAVRAAFEAWGSSEKTLVILGIEHGARADYGHGDLAIGRGLREDVFEPVERFLAR